MKSVTFCFGTHNHQPIGNFDYVFEEAFEKSYKPFFEMAKIHQVKFSTHFSGILLQWLVENKPQYISMLREMITSGKLEMIGGGFYEPILAVINDRDKHSQITKLTDYIQEHLTYNSTGLWLAERVWEQQLATPIAKVGMKYVILDDTHFRAAGLTDSDLTGYYLTEDQGNTIAVFPISKALRYTIPFQSVDDTIKVLREAASESGDHIVTFADDGEKFGVWPQTFDHVYGEGWLEEFFTKLNENASWIKMMHFSEALKAHKPKGRIYLPNASYAEMMQWALPSADANARYESFVHELEKEPNHQEDLQFVRGGFWRNFFVKYPESNHLHKRMLSTSHRFDSLDLIDTDVSEAYDHLLASQCNDPYWHGVFGGIYLPNLRHEVYSNLITAETELDQIEKKDAVQSEVFDLNCDGTNDVVISNKALTIILDPTRGGCISELSVKNKAFNITNFINRQPEAYHEKLKNASLGDTPSSGSTSIHDVVVTKEEGLENHLVYDWYRHGSFIEHFLSRDITIEDFASQKFLEYGTFFKTTIEPSIETTIDNIIISFENEGSVFHHNASRSVFLQKKLTVGYDSSELQFEYLIENRSDELLDLNFGSEWTFGLLSGDAHDRYYASPEIEMSDEEKQLRSTGEILSAKQISLTDEWSGLRIELESEESCRILRAPIETVASSEAGFERVYQGSIVLLAWNLALKPQERRSFALRLRVIEL